MILSVYFLKRRKMSRLPPIVLIIDSSPVLLDWAANFESFSIREIKMFLISTSVLRLLVVSSNCSSVYKWYSSGKAWMTHSIKYCWASVSLHTTTMSRMRGSTICL